jgi:hypothetical protein
MNWLSIENIPILQLEYLNLKEDTEYILLFKSINNNEDKKKFAETVNIYAEISNTNVFENEVKYLGMIFKNNTIIKLMDVNVDGYIHCEINCNYSLSDLVQKYNDREMLKFLYKHNKVCIEEFKYFNYV